MVVEKNIYFEAKKIIHPYHVRISRKNKLVFFRCCATLEEAQRCRNQFLQNESV